MKILNAEALKGWMSDPRYSQWIEHHELDLHIHSNRSDGSDPVDVLMEKICQSGLKFFSLTDHDNVDGVEMILAREDKNEQSDQNEPKEENTLLFVPGIEFSCKLSEEEAKENGLAMYDAEGKIKECEFHILGYGMDLNNPDFLEAVRRNQETRIKKVEERIHFLQENGYPQMTEEDAQRILRENSMPGKPHIVKLMMKKGLINSDEDGAFHDPQKLDKEEIYRLMDQHHSQYENITPQIAVEAIVKAGGMAVLAHGIKGSGSDHFTEEETEVRVRYLKQFGLEALECYYSPYEAEGYQNGFTPEDQRIMFQLAEKYGLFKTAGSDYHGETKKDVLLGRKRL